MLKNRFRKYLPVVVDIETGGFSPAENAILEIAITLIDLQLEPSKNLIENIKKMKRVFSVRIC